MTAPEIKRWIVGIFIALILTFTVGPIAVCGMLALSPDPATAPGTEIRLDAMPPEVISDYEIRRIFNELRGQYLDARAESITWWLMAAAISLAFITVFVTGLGIIIVIGGFFGYQWFRDILAIAREYTDQVKESANQAKTVADKAQSDAEGALELAREASEILEQIRETRQQWQQELEEWRTRTAEDVAMSNEPQAETIPTRF